MQARQFTYVHVYYTYVSRKRIREFFSLFLLYALFISLFISCTKFYTNCTLDFYNFVDFGIIFCFSFQILNLGAFIFLSVSFRFVSLLIIFSCHELIYTQNHQDIPPNMCARASEREKEKDRTRQRKPQSRRRKNTTKNKTIAKVVQISVFLIYFFHHFQICVPLFLFFLFFAL